MQNKRRRHGLTLYVCDRTSPKFLFSRHKGDLVVSNANSEITTVLFDVDGVFTDGSFYYNSDGKVFKKFGPEDGDGIKFLKYLGVDIFAISADHRGFKISEARMKDMGIPLNLVSEAERHTYIIENFDINSLAFVADGIFDSKSLAQARCGIATNNASRSAKRASDYVTSAKGGSGAVSEAAFFIGRTFFPEHFRIFIEENGFHEEDF